MNNNNIRVQAVDSRRQDEIDGGAAQESINVANTPICNKPPNKANKVRAANGGNLVPEDRADRFVVSSIWRLYLKIRDALRIEVYFAMMPSRQSLEQLGQGAFGAMAAIDERGNNRESQVSGSSGGPTAAQPRS